MISNNAKFVMEQGRKVGNIKKIRPPKDAVSGKHESRKRHMDNKMTAPMAKKTPIAVPAMQPPNRKQSLGKVGTFNTKPVGKEGA